MSQSLTSPGYDLLICPAASVVPFPVKERHVGYRERML